MALSLDLAVVFPVLLIISLAILGLYTHVEPYMVSFTAYEIYYGTNLKILLHWQDELFHIPQAQHYCNDQFHMWNQGITTYPGLYWFSFAVARAMRLLVPSAHEHVCSAAMLRSMNVLLSSALPILAYRCRKLVRIVQLSYIYLFGTSYLAFSCLLVRFRRSPQAHGLWH